MAEILVKTPLTTNGRDPLIGEDGKVQYREDILMDNGASNPTSTKFRINKSNATLPAHLQKIVTDYKPEPVAAKPVNYGVWGLKKLQGELEERGLPYDENLEKADLATILKNHDEASK